MTLRLRIVIFSQGLPHFFQESLKFLWIFLILYKKDPVDFCKSEQPKDMCILTCNKKTVATSLYPYALTVKTFIV